MLNKIKMISFELKLYLEKIEEFGKGSRKSQRAQMVCENCIKELFQERRFNLKDINIRYDDNLTTPKAIATATYLYQEKENKLYVTENSASVGGIQLYKI